MKSAYIADLQPDQSITSFFLVRVKEIRTSANTGKAWLHLELADRSGAIDAKMWDNFAEVAASFECDDVVKVRARVKLYHGRNELTVEQIRLAAESEYELEDFIPHTKQDVEKLYARLAEIASSVGNPWLRRLLTCILDDPAIAPKFKRAPAAVTMHHAYIGGLLEHVVSLCGLCRLAAQHYPEASLDLLLTGAILHDIGKIDELGYDRAFSYTTEGQLLGHIVIAMALVRKKAEAVEGFPPELLTLVEHLLVSHHGSLEFGSPRPPMFREAVLLHYLDDLDSKMGAMRATLESPEGEGEWTARNPSLRRALLRVEEYLRGEGIQEKTTAPSESQVARRR